MPARSTWPALRSRGQDAGAFLGRATGVLITDDLDAVLGASQVLIDFTRPEGTLRHLEACAARGVEGGSWLLFATNVGFSARRAEGRPSAPPRNARPSSWRPT